MVSPKLLYSGKFSWGRNFRNFRNQKPAWENLKFLPPKFLTDESSTVSSRHRSSKSTENWPVCCRSIKQTAEIFRNRSTRLLSPQLWTDLCVCSFPLAVSHGSFFADSNRHALITVVTSYYHFDIEIHADGHLATPPPGPGDEAKGHHFHVVNCNGYGQTSWPCHENKNCEIFFLACLLVIRENLCFPLYGITGIFLASLEESKQEHSKVMS